MRTGQDLYCSRFACAACLCPGHGTHSLYQLTSLGMFTSMVLPTKSSICICRTPHSLVNSSGSFPPLCSFISLLLCSNACTQG